MRARLQDGTLLDSSPRILAFYTLLISHTSFSCPLRQDGTLLDSSSRILPSSVSAIKAALAVGVRVILATGKARPAAIRACEVAGLAGEGGGQAD